MQNFFIIDNYSYAIQAEYIYPFMFYNLWM